jgi:polysaccharide biosynthesis protein PelB
MNLSWAIETGWRESARRWAAQRYNSTGEPLPKWAALHLALEAHNHNTLQALLADGGSNLPADGAYDAAMLLERWPLARKLAFERLQQSPSNNDLHERLDLVNEKFGDRVGISFTTAHYDTLDRSGSSLSLEHAFTESFRLGIEGETHQQSLSNRDTLRAVPDFDNATTLHSRWLTSEQEVLLTVTAYDELARYTGYSLGLKQQFDRRITWTASLESRQPVDYSAPLQVAAHADRASLGLDYIPERHFRLGLNATGERYHSQYDTYLGSGNRLTWEAGYWLRENYPDWSIRLSGDHYHFNADGEPDAASLALLDPDTVAATATNQLAGLFIPEDDNYYALCSGAGNAQREGNSRALRPFADLCAIHSDNFGNGYSLIVGIAGSIDNRDHLSLTLEQSNASMQADSRNTQIFTLNYQYIF